ncbi:transcription factor ILR3-like isoform X1 [Dioscorea cayenensis subsp. rotundata]|uniref:Transcription factor ILR3-like isoform X1 n=1 Tax=Dioscorea cayennensis subsp. rotundata TaxID=55577 RepID=A0AB40C6Q5_DIOCR|nr:transcription factor ILR3-like isoform X1 [Dioscorea cayenensis subsp. rotundata]XP_039135511.1 transcription factor ILR3-like isoform X1 [Dioscorea cayenensis subsp. rotundata]
MEPDPAAEYLIDDAGDVGAGSDGELQCAIESLCGMSPSSGMQMGDAFIGGACGLPQMNSVQKMEGGLMYENTRNLQLSDCMSTGMVYSQACGSQQTGVMDGLEPGLVYGDAGSIQQVNTRKRAMDEECSRPKSKACREKMRRDKLNDRFSELSSVLDPGRPPKSDKATILSDAARVLEQLKAEAEELKISNEKLQETIKDLKAEKNELRDEKIKLKTDKERLEQQLKAMNMAPAGYMPHPMVFHPAVFAPQGQTPATKSSSSPAFPSVPMWRWLPPALVDTTKDAKLWPPNA